MFNIDYNKIIELLLPIALRQPIIKGYLNAILKPLKSLFNTMSVYRLDVLNAITHTGQVMYLEHLLNDKFDPFDRYIRIEDSTDARLDDYLFNQSEGQEPMWLVNDSELEDPTLEFEKPRWVFNVEEYDLINDFVIIVPNHYLSIKSEIVELVNKYRQAGKRFKIEFITVNPT